MLQNAVSTSSGALAAGANQTVSAAAAQVTAISLHAGTAAGSVSILNGSSGTVLWKLTLKAETAAGDTTTSVSFPAGLACPSGLYVTVAGTAATAEVAYQPI